MKQGWEPIIKQVRDNSIWDLYETLSGRTVRVAQRKDNPYNKRSEHDEHYDQ